MEQEPQRGLKRYLGAMLAGIALAAGISGVATLIDWRLNPGGLFRDASGTVWPVVCETWISWFLPTAVAAVAVSVIAVVLLDRR